ncbi:MAG: hypothetical protein O7B35_05050 [Deltaproteobacteria bacterium]|nr:hypothetical protein [Deltaproteobacteria bacterium]
MKYSTTKIRPFKTTSPEPEVAVGIFDSRGHAWKDSSLSWLDGMREQFFGLIEGHSLELLSDYRCENFVLLVVERSTAPIKPLPPKIYFAHWELDAWSGHHICIDLRESPPVTTLHLDFWSQREGQGKTPHFEKHVQPLIDQLVSNLKGGESWAS